MANATAQPSPRPSSAAQPRPHPATCSGPAAQPGSGSAPQAPRRRTVYLLRIVTTIVAASAFVAIWGGWVGLGQIAGFGPVNLLPGIGDGLVVDLSITLPLGIEAYAAIALYTAVGGIVQGGARVFAWCSAVGALVLGAVGQPVYHLIVADDHAPTAIVIFVSVLPAMVLGLSSVLLHQVEDAYRRAHQAPLAAPEPSSAEEDREDAEEDQEDIGEVADPADDADHQEPEPDPSPTGGQDTRRRPGPTPPPPVRGRADLHRAAVRPVHLLRRKDTAALGRHTLRRNPPSRTRSRGCTPTATASTGCARSTPSSTAKDIRWPAAPSSA
ncbi:hypothetical protein HNR23_002933 [Nocardiopsis mwathae]|uniref:Uncharacterized protein n=1 Tax=Nocardiopsis mwathae TaxID=1472723 RepID=A0A7W9YIQ4_9ACTN|nr:hypothetical protein [Nocardiopsis mwathae]MBB6172873.1 hypothetical protein [Nocardiopsis mwathae]